MKMLKSHNAWIRIMQVIHTHTQIPYENINFIHFLKRNKNVQIYFKLIIRKRTFPISAIY